MTGQMRNKWAQAAVCAVALVSPLAVSGCASQGGTDSAAKEAAQAPSTAATSSATTAPGGAVTSSSSQSSQSSPSGPAAPTTTSAAPTTAPAAPATPTAPAAPAAPIALDATGGTGLTVSDGSSTVLINGRAVDFGTAVHDPAWSPDGKKVAFIDGGGNLVVANAGGSGRTEVAKNTGGKHWSHPAWQVTPTDQYRQARDNIVFASNGAGTGLWTVAATAHDGKPVPLSISGYSGYGATPPPQTGNQWPTVSGRYGAALYEHDNGSESDVYIRDDYLRQQGGLSLQNAAQPNYVLVGGSATIGGKPEVVFVRSVHGHRHVFLSTLDSPTSGRGSSAVDLTPNATADCTDPAISPDGRTVAYSTPTGVQSISATGSGTPKQVTNTPGFPAFRGVF